MLTSCNKTTHFMLVTSLVVVALGIYLYMNIVEVRRIQATLSKLEGELTSHAALLKKDIADVRGMVLAAQPVVKAESVDEIDFDEDEEVEVEVGDDDVVGIESFEGIVAAVSGQAEPDIVQLPPPNKDTPLTGLKLDELKALCKEKNLSCHGTKDAMIKRLESALVK